MKKIQNIISVVLVAVLAVPLYAQEVVNTRPTSIKDGNLLSAQGSILAGSEPNSIMVVDYPDNIKQIADYVKMIDVAPRQVLIEARVVEVKLEGESSLGVNWDLAKNAGSGPINMGRFNIGSSTTSGLSQAIGYKNTLYPPATTGGDEEPFTLTIFDENINIVLKMLANAYDTKILSAPSIAAVNNHPAKIDITRKEPKPKPTIKDPTEINGVSVPGGITWEMEFEDVGIKLDVTPTITEDDNIIMSLKPDVSEKVSDYPLIASVSGVSQPYTIPVIDSRTANTKVIVGNGKTIIIGGLMHDKIFKGTTKVPVLGDIPFLGRMFKSTKDVHQKTELLIFVSPTIITPKVTQQMAEQEQQKTGKWYYENLPTTALRKAAEGQSDENVPDEKATTPDVNKANDPQVVVKEVIKEKIVEVKTTDDEAIGRKLEALENKVSLMTKKRQSLEKKIFDNK